MTGDILVSAQDLRRIQKESNCVVVDCRFALNRPVAGYQDYLKGHIPGAVYAHLDNDLSSPVTRSSGRHPLPDAEKFASFLGQSGWEPGKSLIVYDDASGAIASRLWWLMKYFGHNCTALLNGGIRAWQAAGFQLESGKISVPVRPAVSLRVCDDLVLSTAEVVSGLGNKDIVLVDARAQKRFEGKLEPIDAVAGHIPGALNFPCDRNLAKDGLFKKADEVRSGFLKLAGDSNTQNLVHMCGSGVTACLNIFAAELAGFNDSKLYVGSWSEWIRDPSRPVGPL
jgi:thiosulfate/3-mercaptopyruvate sulfurtransferase